MPEGQTRSDYGNILEVHCVETVTGDWLIYYGTASHHSIELDAATVFPSLRRCPARCFRGRLETPARGS